MKLEGYFGRIKDAKETVEKLKSMGFSKAFLDTNDHFTEDTHSFPVVPGTETAVSLSATVLNTSTRRIESDKGPLTAASPMVSGFGNFEEVADINCKVTVEANESDAVSVKQVIKDMGGELENPNFRKPHIDNEDEIAMYDTLKESQDFLNGNQLT